jgi:regulator of replication initiation timing
MRLSTLERSIQDALVTQETLKQQINDMIAENRDERTELDQAGHRLNLVEKYVSAEQKAVKNSSEQVEKLQASIASRRDKMSEGRSLMEKTDQDMDSALEKLFADKERSSKVRDDIRGQRRRICEDLNTIFRIEPVPNGKPLQFQILGISLPNAEDYGGAVMSGAEEDALSAALGHVALLTHHLQFYLGVALPYPITCCGSRSYITDDISIIQDSIRDFPLYLPRGGSAAHFRFDYGWFILNKNIETLCAAQDLKVMDIRHTLPNLKYLLYVCSAGTDELPERTKGGVRGLRAGIMRSRGVSVADDADSVMSSRRGSVDSDLPAGGRSAGDEAKRKLKGLRGQGVRDDDSKVPEISDVGVPFDEGFGKLTLRTKGMREHVGK